MRAAPPGARSASLRRGDQDGSTLPGYDMAFHLSSVCCPLRYNVPYPVDRTSGFRFPGPAGARSYATLKIGCRSRDFHGGGSSFSGFAFVRRWAGQGKILFCFCFWGRASAIWSVPPPTTPPRPPKWPPPTHARRPRLFVHERPTPALRYSIALHRSALDNHRDQATGIT